MKTKKFKGMVPEAAVAEIASQQRFAADDAR